MKKRIVFTAFIAFVTIVGTNIALADTPCTPLFGGGTNTDGSPYCMETVMAMQTGNTPKNNAGDVNQNQGSTSYQTKGGLTVQNSPSMNRQPSTGPEMLGLMAIPSLAAAGWYLRRQTARIIKA